MNSKSLVRFSNIVGIIAIIFLLYWVFAFTSITVLGLKVFKENMTETFFMSIGGILALMLGSLMINVMFNLTRIADRHNLDDATNSSKSIRKAALFIAFGFPVVFAALYIGDLTTTSRKERMLVASAESIIQNDESKALQLANYSFTKPWLRNMDDIIDLYTSTDSHFPYVAVIVPDTLAKTKVFLTFHDFYQRDDDTTLPDRRDYIMPTTQEEREYLTDVLRGNSSDYRFSASDGRYQLFYPYIKNGKRIVLYFSDYQRYGKVGS